ncbi:MAG: UMP kinase [bacterium]|nr:UMP kinase [bacterium]
MINKKTVVLSLGGSLIVPDAIDEKFLKNFTNLILRLSKNYRFVIFTGGGSVARSYQQSLAKINSGAEKDAKDWVGIQASILNAELLKQSLGNNAHTKIITDPRVKLRWTKNVWVGAGWKPGRSTDYDAVRIALENGISSVINLSNIDYVYTKDPNKYKNAEKITDITWSEFRKIIGRKWDPGLNVPFDPVAAGLAQKYSIHVKIINGKNLTNVENAIKNKKIKGTSIS